MKFLKIIYTFFVLIYILFVIACSPKIATTGSTSEVPKDTLKKIKKGSQAEKPALVEDEYYKKNYFRYEDYIYNDNIKTVLLYKEGFALAPPLIQLGSSEKLKLSFDDFNDDSKTFKYTIIHCDANWKPSDLMPTEYIDGFTEDNINTYSTSFNTLQKYYHYDLVFPTENLRPTKSGNYILKVYKDDDTDENLMFTRRFMILPEQ